MLGFEEKTMIKTETFGWKSFEEVVEHFLANREFFHYVNILNNMLNML